MAIAIMVRPFIIKHFPHKILIISKIRNSPRLRREKPLETEAGIFPPRYHSNCRGLRPLCRSCRQNLPQVRFPVTVGYRTVLLNWCDQLLYSLLAGDKSACVLPPYTQPAALWKVESSRFVFLFTAFWNSEIVSKYTPVRWKINGTIHKIFTF